MIKVKSIFIFLVLVFSIKANSQTVTTTPDGIMDTVYDRFGNKHYIGDLEIIPDNSSAAKMVSSTTSCSAGYFNVYFANNSGFEQVSNPTHIAKRAVICELLSNLSGLVNPGLINTNTRVNLLVDDPTFGAPGALASATGFYVFPPASTNPGYIVNSIQKTIITQQNAFVGVTSPLFATGGLYHGVMYFSNTASWNTNMSIIPSSPTFDLYHIALHEITHALGFASNINFNGNWKFRLN